MSFLRSFSQHELNDAQPGSSRSYLNQVDEENSGQEIEIDVVGNDDETEWQLEHHLWIKVSNNAYGACIYTILMGSSVVEIVSSIAVMIFAFNMQCGFIWWLNSYIPVSDLTDGDYPRHDFLGTYMPGDQHDICRTPLMPQLFAIALFVISMLNGAPTIMQSSLICLTSRRTRKSKKAKDEPNDKRQAKPREKTIVRGKSCDASMDNLGQLEASIEYLNSTPRQRLAAFFAGSVTEFVSWSSTLYVGIKYILWNGTKSDSSTFGIEQLILSTVAISFINEIDECIFAAFYPRAIRSHFQSRKFEIDAWLPESMQGIHDAHVDRRGRRWRRWVQFQYVYSRVHPLLLVLFVVTVVCGLRIAAHCDLLDPDPWPSPPAPVCVQLPVSAAPPGTPNCTPVAAPLTGR